MSDFEIVTSCQTKNSEFTPKDYIGSDSSYSKLIKQNDISNYEKRRDSLDITLAEQEAERFFDDSLHSHHQLQKKILVNQVQQQDRDLKIPSAFLAKNENLGMSFQKNIKVSNQNLESSSDNNDDDHLGDRLANRKSRFGNGISSNKICNLDRNIDMTETLLKDRNFNELSQFNELIGLSSNTLLKDDDDIKANSHSNSINNLNDLNNEIKEHEVESYQNYCYSKKKNNWRISEHAGELRSLQEKYSKAVIDFKLLRSHLSENMEKNLLKTEGLQQRQLAMQQQQQQRALQRFPSSEQQYKSLENVLNTSEIEQQGHVQPEVVYRNKHLNRFSSQEYLYKRHSDIVLDERYRNPNDLFYKHPQHHQRDNSLSSYSKISSYNVNNDYNNEFISRLPFDEKLINQEHQSQLRDQAAKSNFERYLKGNNVMTNDNILDIQAQYKYSAMEDVGYSGSGSTSPRENEPIIPSDQLSSRSGSIRSHNSRASSALASVDSGVRMSYIGQHSSLVVVAIDFGTTFSGYAFSFTRDSSSIHMMRRWEGGDPGVTNQKTPTTLLLKPNGTFHSFGFGARDFYHDLDASEAKRWYYFDKFKMTLHGSEDLHAGIEIKAANGKLYPALKVFSHALKFFKDHVLQELFNQSTAKLTEEDITWVLTVPAIWRQPAKQFMRTAAYEAGIASIENPDRLLIALEPEAASIFCRKLRIRDCVIEDDLKAKVGDNSLLSDDFEGLTQYIVVDCGGGTVDLTVHELDVTQGTLKELHKGTGGPCGATGVDREFEKLLKRIFDPDFIERFKEKRPAAWIDLMISFEAKKRTARPDNETPLNLSLPFSFIEYHKKHRKSSVENAIKKFKNPDVKWSSQGMLRFSASIMKNLFKPVVNDIIGHIQNLLTKASLKHVEFLFLVGGFAESPLLQYAIREALESRVRVIIPNDVGLAILKGAVLFGLDPTVVRVRRSAYTYGVGVLNKYDAEKHDQTKRVVKDGITWCKDIFDCFVRVDESVGIGDRVTRSYAPARSKQKSTVINIYCTEKLDILYTTDKGVTRCGKLRIEMPDINPEEIPIEKRGKPRELQASMIFGDTEIKVSAVDVLSGRAARAAIDFLNY